jgi:hypothetical protein
MTLIVPREFGPPDTAIIAARIHNRSKFVEIAIIGHSGNITGQGARYGPGRQTTT